MSVYGFNDGKGKVNISTTKLYLDSNETVAADDGATIDFELGTISADKVIGISEIVLGDNGEDYGRECITRIELYEVSVGNWIYRIHIYNATNHAQVIDKNDSYITITYLD